MATAIYVVEGLFTDSLEHALSHARHFTAPTCRRFEFNGTAEEAEIAFDAEREGGCCVSDAIDLIALDEVFITCNPASL